MRKVVLLAMVCCSLGLFGKTKPVTVIITAGQSNTDGRVMNEYLPDYIQQNRYKYCQWCYGSTGQERIGEFELFWPRMIHSRRSDRWAYDAVTYYWLERALQTDFYVVKWSLGGTAIDTTSGTNRGRYWSAEPEWLKTNHSTITGGNSLLLSFIENISSCIDNKLSKLPQGHEIKAFLWHQGESDRRRGKNYYKNMKALVAYVRNFLVEKTGDKKYKKLSVICGTVARSNKGYSSDVEAALYRLAEEDKNFYVIDMSKAELQKDRMHFTAESAEYLGIQMYNKLVDLGIAGKKAKKIGIKK